MLYVQDIDACFRAVIGAGGLDPGGYEATLADTAPALAALAAQRAKGELPLLAYAEKHDDLPRLAEIAAEYRERFSDVLVWGTGGSSLGARTLCALAGSRPCPRLRFLENVDPHSLESDLAAADPATTGVLVVSKSGGTLETVAQCLVVFDWLSRAMGEDGARERVTAIVEPGNSPLRRFVARHGLRCLDHDPGLGGRFSVFSLVGLLPALIAGLDAQAVRSGAAEVLDAALVAETPEASAPAVGAALSVALARQSDVAMTVLLVYADRLAELALWYRQLWAESLGKQGRGTTPLRALGTVDQHSQLQLYLDGPADKMFTLLTVPASGAGPRIEAALATDAGLDYLAGRTIGDVFDACAEATAETLIGHGRPVRRIRLRRIDERTLGGLMMHFMLETIVAARLLGIDPFDQPAVEDGKRRARQRLLAAGEETS